MKEFLHTLESGLNDIKGIEFSFHKLEQELDVPEKFISSLMEEDDWSFIIKCHALIESLLNQSITKTLNEPSLEKVISRLDTSHPSIGKLTIAKELELLDNNFCNVIRII